MGDAIGQTSLLNAYPAIKPKEYVEKFINPVSGKEETFVSKVPVTAEMMGTVMRAAGEDARRNPAVKPVAKMSEKEVLANLRGGYEAPDGSAFAGAKAKDSVGGKPSKVGAQGYNAIRKMQAEEAYQQDLTRRFNPAMSEQVAIEDARVPTDQFTANQAIREKTIKQVKAAEKAFTTALGAGAQLGAAIATGGASSIYTVLAEGLINAPFGFGEADAVLGLLPSALRGSSRFIDAMAAKDAQKVARMLQDAKVSTAQAETVLKQISPTSETLKPTGVPGTVKPKAGNVRVEEVPDSKPRSIYDALAVENPPVVIQGQDNKSGYWAVKVENGYDLAFPRKQYPTKEKALAAYREHLRSHESYDASMDYALHSDPKLRAESHARLLAEYEKRGMVPTPPVKEAVASGTPKPETPPQVAAPKAVGGVPAEAESFASPAAQPAGAPRVQVAAIPGKTVKNVAEIILDLSRGVGKKLQYGSGARSSIGTYYPGTSATTVRFAGDITTSAHEIAHSLDDQFNIVGSWAGSRVRSPYDGELFQPAFQQTIRKSYTLKQKRAEGVAEWVRAWIANPMEAERLAPQFSAFAKTKLPPNIKSALKSFSDDVRAFAGGTATQQIQAQVRWKPPIGGFADWLLRRTPRPGPGFSLTWGDKLAKGWTDTLRPFERAVEFLKKERGVTKIHPSSDPMLLARLANGATSKMDSIFENGMIVADGTRSTKGFHTLFEPLAGRTKNEIEVEAKDVAAYMIAQRTIEKQEKLGKVNVAGLGSGVLDELEVAKRMLSEISADPARLARITEASKRYREWADATLKYLVDKGRLSTKAYDAIKQNNEFYVAMKRVMELGPEEEAVSFGSRGTGKALGSHAQPIHKFKGSAKQIENPYSTLLEATYKAVKEADKNEVLQAFRNLAKSTGRGMYQGDPIDLASVMRKAGAADKRNVITIFVDGKAERWLIPDETLYKTFKGISDDPSLLPGWATILARVLRVGVIQMPTFAVRNKIRDVLTTAISSKSGTNIVDMLKRSGPDAYNAFRETGGGQFGYYMKDPSKYYGRMDSAIKDLAASRNTIILNPLEVAKRGGRAYESLILGSEVSTRLAEYKKALTYAKTKLGYSDADASLYAAGEARGLLDFAVAGDYIRVINQIVPFTNAGVQGLRRAVSAVRSKPLATGARWATYVLVPIAGERVWNRHKGADKEYEQLPSYQKDMFFNYKIGDDLWLSIPKPFEYGVVGSLVGRTVDYAMGDKKAMEGAAHSVVEAMSPLGRSDLLGGPAAGVVGATTNFDIFREKPIVPPHEEQLNLEHRDTSKSSRLGQGLQSVFGMDARKIDHLIRQQFGYAGMYATEFSDIGRKDQPPNAEMLTGLLRGSPVSQARDVAWVSQYARGNGLTNQSQYKTLRDKLDDYYEASTAEVKQSASNELLRYATEVRALWEGRAPPLEFSKRDEFFKKHGGADDVLLSTLASHKLKFSMPSRDENETDTQYDRRSKTYAEILHGALKIKLADADYRKMSKDKQTEALKKTITAVKRRVSGLPEE